MRFLLILISLLSYNLISEENEMIPLDKWVEKSGNLGTAEMLYLSYRCFSLYGMMNSLTADVNNEQQADLSKRLQDAQLTVLLLAEQAYNDLTAEEDREFEANFERSIMPMVENYRLETNKSWTNTGDYFNDYILGDAEICQQVVETINAK